MAIIEFAFVFPVLLLILFGIIDLSMIFFTSSVLESATNVGSRIGKTGYSAKGQTREEYIRERIYESSAGLMEKDRVKIQILSYDSFQNIGQGEPCYNPPTCTNFKDINHNGHYDSDLGVTGPGGAGAVVLYRVSYPWPLLTPFIRQIMGDGEGNINLTSVATVRNEPF